MYRTQTSTLLYQQVTFRENNISKYFSLIILNKHKLKLGELN